jgi:hypothetical protein
MKGDYIMRITLVGLIMALFATTSSAFATAKPLKIYILAGQSNMEGHARVETFDYIGEDPATAPMLKEMRNSDGKPRVCDDVWISYLTGMKQVGEGHGKLTAGYGARSNPEQDGGKIGPEFTFGIYMGKAYDGPVLLIKTAWGGKSLNTDFRPPSAGPYELPDKIKELWAKHPDGAHGVPAKKDRQKWQEDKDAKAGHYYRLMISHVKKVLGDIKRVYPDYDPKQGYELAGFVWFQGWNDMCDGQTYPERDTPGGYDEYTTLMAHFIRDVRSELAAPALPFVIGVIGVSGDRATGSIANLRPAMAAPSTMKEFKGTVAAVQTGDFWDHEMEALLPKKGQAEHLLRAAYVIADDGTRQERETDAPGWRPIGTPLPDDRTWRFTSFNPQKKDDELVKTEKKRFREVELPAELQEWHTPEFDDSKWSSGKAPIGKGTWKHRNWPEVKYNSDWGDGEFILMRTTFELDSLDYAAYRISVLASQGFQVYLNGHKIHTYIWWKDEPSYRPIGLDAGHTKFLKKGANVLAAYATTEYAKKTQESFSSIDLMIEGITEAGLKYVESEEYIFKQMDKVCTRREAKIMRGSSNAGYHYLGSGKILGQIGKAFADAMLKLEDR